LKFVILQKIQNYFQIFVSSEKVYTFGDFGMVTGGYRSNTGTSHSITSV